MSLPCVESDTPDNWFAPPGTMRAFGAKGACFQRCPVLNQCAEYAISNGIPYGVWGGIDERERQRIWDREGGKPTTFTDEIDAAAAGVSLLLVGEGSAA